MPEFDNDGKSAESTESACVRQKNIASRIPGASDVFAVYALVLAYIAVAGKAFNAIGNKWVSLFFSVGLGVIPLLYAVLKRFSVQDTFRFKRPTARGFLGGIILMLGVFAVVITAVGLLAPFLPASPKSDAIVRVQIADDSVLYSIAALAVLPAIFEELLCRGFILSGLRGVLSERWSIVFCSFLFALLHFEIARIPFMFCAGLALSWVAVETGSLVLSTAMHFFYNFLLFAIVRYGNTFAGIPVPKIVNPTVSSIAWIVFGLAAIVLGVRIVKRASFP